MVSLAHQCWRQCSARATLLSRVYQSSYPQSSTSTCLQTFLCWPLTTQKPLSIRFQVWCLYESLPLTAATSMGYSTLSSQALSAPPYLVAFVVVLFTAFYSDKCKNRSLFICFHALLASLGYAMIALAGIFKAGPMWRYCGVYPAASGFFSAVTLLITWTINNQV